MKGHTLFSDRRVSPRFTADFPLKVEVKKPHCRQTVVCGRTVNVSREGLLLILASRPEAGKRLGETAKAGYWPWDDKAFEQVRNFLQQLAHKENSA